MSAFGEFCDEFGMPLAEEKTVWLLDYHSFFSVRNWHYQNGYSNFNRQI